MRKADTTQKTRDFAAYLQNASSENKSALAQEAKEMDSEELIVNSAPALDDLPTTDDRHRIHNPGSFVKVTQPKGRTDRYGMPPRGKK